LPVKVSLTHLPAARNGEARTERFDEVDFVDFDDEVVDRGELREFDELRELFVVVDVEEVVRAFKRPVLI
jgi:hypothetical protein